MEYLSEQSASYAKIKLAIILGLFKEHNNACIFLGLIQFFVKKDIFLSISVDRWLNLTQEVVCFGARDSKFASVVIPLEGFLTSLKLIHVTGHVSCDSNAPQHNRKWGCSRSHPTLGRTPFNIVVTAGKHNGILFPIDLFMKDSKKESLWYDITDVDPDALELVLGDLSYPYYVTSGQELRIWLGKDYQNVGKVEVEGKVCFAVKGWFI